MKTRTDSPAPAFKTMPADYGTLCRRVWLPRPIRDKADYAAALAAIEPLWGHEKSMTQDQTDWFELVAGLIAEHEASTEKKAKPLPVTKRLAGLLEAAQELLHAPLEVRSDFERVLDSLAVPDMVEQDATDIASILDRD